MAGTETITREARARFEGYPRTLDCVHCGLCLSSCPTFGVTGNEADSPRGRILLLRSFAEGRLEPSGSCAKHLLQCIVCRACESACPSGVRMSDMMEEFRGELVRRGASSGFAGWITRYLLRNVFPRRQRIAAISDLLYVYQQTGLDGPVRFVLRRAFPRLAEMEALLPSIPHPEVRRIDTDRTRPEGYPCEGKPRLRAGLFLGCIASEWFAETHRATIRVLRRNRIDVVVPDGQTCCGALHRHSGLVEEAAALHEQNATAFAGAGVDVVVVNAAGCGASLREAPARSTARGGPEVRDICEFLDEVGIVPPTARMERRVAYHQPCHLVHAQGVGPGSVERLLSSIPGLRLLPLRDSDRCCGSGGIYNVLHPRLAGPILEAKIAAIQESGADTVVTGNPGCLLQIRSRLRGVRILHPVELLDLAYSRSTPSGPSGDSTASA